MNAPDIDQLKELALPTPVSWLPQTWGWLALLLVTLFVLLSWAALRYRRWQRSRYRREALSRLVQLEQALDDPARRLAALRELPELLKRVALSMPGAPPVAALGGNAWQAFLARHGGEPLPADFAQQLAQLAYAPHERLRSLSSDQCRQLLGLCRAWVEKHHVAA
ncbi:DUF4381 domain-containing protein [Azomonas macrocytogenes]|uniref:DUF4381 domain-containing protein n=1 Tax=Azomonas macrocytogenes TaxID=69962 RepID=A0A839TBY2_AZOMA|nr:DUF4381 domain-containing protein [Azomonas macrocytogenes]MBB3105103.1 hypothetical protein [Azomonas macrocytogenes]